MRLGDGPRALGKGGEGVRVQAARGWDLILAAPEHAGPVFDDVLHPEGVEGDVLPLQDGHRLVGEGVDAQAQHGDVGGEVVADAAGLVAGLPGQRGEVIRIADHGGPVAGNRDTRGRRVFRRGHAVVDVAEAQRWACGRELARDVPLDLA